MKIYLASPFFNQIELDYYKQALSILRGKQLQVYAPLENQLKRENLSKEEWANKTFSIDVEQIEKCDVVVMLFYGLYSDSGTAWECGYAFGIKKPIVAVHLHEGKSNCMINCSCLANLNGIEALANYDFEKLQPISWYNKQILG